MGRGLDINGVSVDTRRYPMNRCKWFCTLPIAALGMLWSPAPVPVAAQFSAPASGKIAGCPWEPTQFYPCALAKAKTFNPPRTPDGKPNLQGIWDKSANDIEEHNEPFELTGTYPGPTLIVDPPDGKVPYQPWAFEQRKVNRERYIAPKAECLLPSPSQHQYMTYSYQIFQNPESVLIVHEHVHSYRSIPISDRPHLGKDIKLFLGDPRGRWDGNTLVIDTRNVNARNWIDRAGNFYSPEAHLVERFTLIDPDVILYEVTIDDPNVYTRPWKMAMSLARIKEKGFELGEESCHEGNRSRDTLLEQGLKPYPGYMPPK
jgi:hypothetical protein